VKKKILIVDDEASIRFGLRDFLFTNNYQVEEADSCATAEEAYRKGYPDAVILDYLLPDGNALDLLPKLKEIAPSIPVIILTAHASIDLAVRAVKEGAEYFLTKPVELSALSVLLHRLIENQRNRKKQLARESRDARETVDPFLGSSKAIRELEEQAKRVAETDTPILIQGATGTGKSLLASWLHNHSLRSSEAFVDLNCSTLKREFLETELFGHEKGAFTGAITSKPGLLEVAQPGTVFLDEIGDLDMEVQPKLLTVLENKKFRRLGDVRDRFVDIRLIFATHQNLAELVQEKKFRSDLYFRISTFPLDVPSLRQRLEDIPALARNILKYCSADLGREETELSKEAELTLHRYPWPGNIRELKNVLERALLLTDKKVLTEDDLKFDTRIIINSASDSQLTLIELERKHIENILREERGRVEDAAKRLGIPRSSLYQKIKRYNLNLEDF
jgi:DNA-binding NtrC family response regulator